MMTKRNKPTAGTSAIRIKVQPSPKEKIRREKMSTAIGNENHTLEKNTGSNIRNDRPEHATGVSFERSYTRMGKNALQNRSTTMTIIWLVVLSIVAMGTIGGLVWNFFRTDATESIENGNVFKSASITAATITTTQAPTVAVTTPILETKETTEYANDFKSTSILIIDTPSIKTLSTEVTTSEAAVVASTKTSATRMVTTPIPEVAYNTNIEVLKSKEVMYGGYNFLAVQIRVPSDGRSKSENWCREYQYLCEHFSRRPTGCSGEPFTSISFYKECSSDYNSDMSIGKILGCNPGRNITDLINIAFEKISPPAQLRSNAFGFHLCSATYCKRTIKESEIALTYMNAFWDDNEKIMYTVCH